MVVCLLGLVGVLGMFLGLYKLLAGNEANVSTKRWYALLVVSALALAATTILSWMPWPWGLTTQ